MARSLLISDLHLDPLRPELTQAFKGFLIQEARNCDALYILGDLFEAWVGDDDDSPLATEVAQALKALTADGVALFLMRGNRDFLLGEDFCRAVGATLLTDPCEQTIQGLRVTLLHGDSLCTADEDYQAFRALARSAEWQAGVLAMTLAERRVLAEQIRSSSMEANSNKAEDIMDVAPEAVAELFRTTGIGHMIHGHTHRPFRHDGPGGTRWVLGDWTDQGWSIEIADGNIELNSFPLNQYLSG